MDSFGSDAFYQSLRVVNFHIALDHLAFISTLSSSMNESKLNVLGECSQKDERTSSTVRLN